MFKTILNNKIVNYITPKHEKNKISSNHNIENSPYSNSALHPKFFESLEQLVIAERVQRYQQTYQNPKTKKFLLFNYLWHLPIFDGYINIGDYIQTYAVESALKKIFECKISYFDRDNLSFYENENLEKQIAIMQGWFSHSINFFPSKYILPVWLGTHFDIHTRKIVQKAITINPNYFQTDVGCRDLSTLNFLNNLGISTYFSRCLTLTLSKQSIQQNCDFVYFVDVPEELMVYFPNTLKRNSIKKTQKWINSNHEKWEDTYERAKNILGDYSKNAKLVITTALHCAAPCLAMGIPVILISLDPKENFNRFSALDGILSYYTVDDLISGKIDFSPSQTNIETLKDAMLLNLKITIDCATGSKERKSELKDIREYISSFKIKQ